MDTRAIAISLNADFKERLRAAMQKIKAGYPIPQHYEQRLYLDGFPSKEDQKYAWDFHLANSWRERLTLAIKIVDKRLRFFALRVIYSECPAVLSPVVLN